ncbi:MAG: hypothetical protein J6T94_04970 [Bacteroidaceae bacterium]|nr:hypothetical protein [Bacteroidaceae bacterium]
MKKGKFFLEKEKNFFEKGKIFLENKYREMKKEKSDKPNSSFRHEKMLAKKM